MICFLTFLPPPPQAKLQHPSKFGQKSGSDPENPGSGSKKKNFKITRRNFFLISYFTLSTVNPVLFGQVRPKPYQKHHLDPISLLMDGSGFNVRIGEKKKPAPSESGSETPTKTNILDTSNGT